jgi:hypothetical protein
MVWSATFDLLLLLLLEGSVCIGGKLSKDRVLSSFRQFSGERLSVIRPTKKLQLLTRLGYKSYNISVLVYL